MNILDRALNLVGLERRATNPNDTWGAFQALRTGPVNDQTAQGVSAVYACVQAISETAATLPLPLYRRNGDDREKASDHPLFKVLNDQFNPEQTAMEGREYLTACVLLRGNAYARIVRGYDGQVRELWPISPDRMTVLRLDSGRLAYEYADTMGRMHRLLPEEVLHLRHRLADDGVMGISPIQAARGVVELAISEQDHGVNTFRNGARLLGVLKFPGKLKPDQRTAIRESWASQHAGGSNAGKTAILEEGVDYQTVSMTLEDAEWIEARKLSVIEVCRLFRVPPVIVQSMESANYSNSVELARQFVTLTMRRHLTMWESAISAKCLTDAGRRIYYPEHNVEGMLRGDSANRSAFYASGITSGWMLKSEARKLENLPTIAGIDDAPAESQTPNPTSAPQPYPSKQKEAA